MYILLLLCVFLVSFGQVQLGIPKKWDGNQKRDGVGIPRFLYYSGTWLSW